MVYRFDGWIVPVGRQGLARGVQRIDSSPPFSPAST
jgi:hypothetical protein